MRNVEILLSDNVTVGKFRVPAEITMEGIKKKQDDPEFVGKYRTSTRPMKITYP